ncbi:DUF4190 domain-containing protein [Kitasatospora purpeofusca]|uniref:DUF4190 domain-containing protein n=1 Tax=Kitasatospora purpeofusca TaxID=67352 RepID=UPI0022512DC8|nr:DUF4190 domain-containing protein [Kitasatospora purpeofusca]MCX4754678.1 DUF4190 domain-containing protein [Kitasatospora purpeofusca]WSR34083.1 DUF4190 domain-containing protein [Kitasatospora purpeofusca]
MSKPESDAAVVPAPTPESDAAAVPAPTPGPATGPTPESGPATGPTSEQAPVGAPEPAAAPWTAPAPAAPPFPSVAATSAEAPAAGPVPPAADPWAAPADVPPPRVPDPADPAAPQPTGWAAVTPASQSGFQPGFPYPAAPTRTNGFAIAALVTSLFCLWPLALVFAVVALVQIPRRNEKGRGLAVSGLVVGVLSLIVSLIAFIGLAALGFDEERYADSRHGPKGSVAVNDLRVGDCFDQPPLSGDPGSTSVYWVRVVPCTAPHHAEVAGTVVLPGQDGQYPSRKEFGDGAEKLCGPVRDEYALDSWLVPEGMEGYYYYPSVRGWTTGDHRVTCTFQDEQRPHTGSVRTDRTKITQAQRAYLDAVLAYNKALLAEPDLDVDVAPAKYREWAKSMAAACRKEVAELSANGTDWPEAARPKLIELGALKLDAANAWDTAAKTMDPDALEREVGKADALSVKSGRLAVDIRRALGLSTGEQASDIRA